MQAGSRHDRPHYFALATTGLFTLAFTVYTLTNWHDLVHLMGSGSGGGNNPGGGGGGPGGEDPGPNGPFNQQADIDIRAQQIANTYRNIDAEGLQEEIQVLDRNIAREFNEEHYLRSQGQFDGVHNTQLRLDIAVRNILRARLGAPSGFLN